MAFGVEMFVITYPDQEGEKSQTFRNGSKDVLQVFTIPDLSQRQYDDLESNNFLLGGLSN